MTNLKSLRQVTNPHVLSSEHLRALWYDLNDDWDTAHNIVQVMTDVNAMWIHAYLHRKEPDIWNAKYWYNRCRKPFPDDMDFETEATAILEILVSGKHSGQKIISK